MVVLVYCGMKFDINHGHIDIRKAVQAEGKNLVIGQVVRDTRLTAVRGGLTPAL